MKNQQPQNWRKSTYSQAQTDCVEVADDAATALIRDSKAPNDGVIGMRREAFNAFKARIRGEMTADA
ncbi:DUF397 domain-containing protein [Amycolatopsis sp. NPDC021455]|uniref:DUF397 domain-containing protein n=1 Tax=Amycolatopsis sp. NPDC021455 TaxID=3154901 RepID=UPI0033F7B7E8